ncbi:MAG TPA: DUF6714 family protein [Xanthomonadales bacterium]|nr:DUF6714 family protein [Xanthomonadales bacterium]
MNPLIEKIRKAFADVAIPDEEALTNSFGDEADALVRDFRDKTSWEELSPGFLNQAPEGWGSALSFFSAQALQAFLPAYMIADIEGTLEIGDPTPRLCSFVTPMMQDKKIAKFYGGGTLGEHARREFSIFSDEQVTAIVAYLWWKLEDGIYNPIVEQALENYWLERADQSSE